MHRRRFLSLTASTLVAVNIARPAFAHRQHLSITDVVWSAGSSSLQVTHNIHLHDAQAAVVSTGKTQTPDLTTLRDKAVLALYIEERFALFTGKTALPLSLIGAEADGNHILVYQEARLDAAPKSLSVNCEILRDIFSDQRNHVNVTLLGPVQSLTFAARDGVKTTL